MIIIGLYGYSRCTISCPPLIKQHFIPAALAAPISSKESPMNKTESGLTLSAFDARCKLSGEGLSLLTSFLVITESNKFSNPNVLMAPSIAFDPTLVTNPTGNPFSLSFFYRGFCTRI